MRVLGVLLIALSIFLTISLLTYSQSDSHDPFHTKGLISNWGGRLGAFFSYYFYHLVGYPVLLLPLLLLLWGWNRFRCAPKKGLVKRTFLLSLLGLTFCLATNAMSFIPHNTQYRLGGRVGASLAGFFLRYIGYVGTYILLVSLLLIVLLLTAEHPLARFSEWFVKRKALSAMRRTEKKVRKEEKRERKEEKRRTKRKKEKEVKKEPSQPKPKVLERKKRDIQDREKKEIVPSETAGYLFPTLDLLEDPPVPDKGVDKVELQANASILETKLADFGVEGKVVQVNPGPVITRYELEPAPGVKVSRIASLSDDLALAMKAKSIRILAPIPGKAAVGIEMPNPHPSVVSLKEILSSREFQRSTSKLTFALGKTISGEPFCTDLATMPHLLIAGATGSGKSVCINALICSILLNRTHPQQVQFLMIDPKMLELPLYNGIPHLTRKVITNSEKASETLKLVVNEMEKRYRQLAKIGVRDIATYNERVQHPDFRPPEDEGESLTPLPYYVIIVDELADLMLSAFADDIESALTRLAQMARAVGIHLVLATQRPSVDVITGLIKANFPTRIAFQVASKIDSRTILDTNGAEKLLGTGDMLFLTPRHRESLRIHGSYISTKETEEIVQFIKKQHFAFERPRLPEQSPVEKETADLDVQGYDDLFEKDRDLVIRHQQGSVSLLQRRLGIGYARAGRIMDQLEKAGVVGPFDGSKARQVLIDRDEMEEFQGL
ncbi:MAG: DNA translocase FtsK [Gemmatimonadota bacterium]|nr:MAG: DNA translocase FtsK [Gemmatimonadota bacterium]